jgi:hypothetical protein
MAPKVKPPTPEAEIEDYVAPNEPIEITLAGDEPAETQIEVTPAKVAPVVPAEEDNPLQKALDAQSRAEELQRTTMRERDEALN